MRAFLLPCLVSTRIWRDRASYGFSVSAEATLRRIWQAAGVGGKLITLFCPYSNYIFNFGNILVIRLLVKVAVYFISFAEATLRRIWQAAGGSPLPHLGACLLSSARSWWREYPEGRGASTLPQNNTLPEREIDSPDSPVSAPSEPFSYPA